MGRGPGCWQRLILEALETHPLVSVTGLVVQALSRPLTPTEYAAVIRAAHTLAKRGRIVLVRTLGEDATGRENVMLLALTPEVAAKLPEEVKVKSVRNRTDLTHRSARTIRGSVRHIARLLGMSKSAVWEHIRRERTAKKHTIGKQPRGAVETRPLGSRGITPVRGGTIARQCLESAARYPFLLCSKHERGECYDG